MGLDLAGNVLWDRDYDELDDGFLRDVSPTADGGYVAYGRFGPQSTEGRRLWVYKTDSTGNTACGQDSMGFVVQNVMVNDSTNLLWLLQSGGFPGAYNDLLTPNTLIIHDTVCLNAVCNVSPQISLSDSVFCVGDTLWATDLTAGSDSSFWILDGQALGAGQQLILPVSGSGSQNLQLVTQQGLCRDTLLRSIQVNAAPGPIQVNYTQNGFNFSFSDNTPGALTWQWDFGDGGTDSIASPVHTYAPGGPYIVCLQVSGAGGCLADTCFVLDCILQTNWFISDTAICDSDTFMGINLSAGVTSTTWLSNGFVVGQSDTLDTAAWWLGQGIIQLTMFTTVGNCSDSLSTLVNIYPAPAPLVINYNNLGLVYNFTLPGISDPVFWDFGDGDTSNVTNPQHTYAQSGNYTVCATVAIPGPCVSEACTTITVMTGIADAMDRAGVRIIEQNWLEIRLASTPLSEVQFQLYDMQGKAVLSRNLTEQVSRIEIPTVSAGIYMYEMKGKGLQQHGKLLINR